VKVNMFDEHDDELDNTSVHEIAASGSFPVVVDINDEVVSDDINGLFVSSNDKFELGETGKVDSNVIREEDAVRVKPIDECDEEPDGVSFGAMEVSGSTSVVADVENEVVSDDIGALSMSFGDELTLKDGMGVNDSAA
jgi:hypothetical protein